VTPDATIDISDAPAYQRAGRIRWPGVPAGGTELVIARAIYAHSPDASYAANVAGARGVGLATGAYAFLRPGDPAGQAHAYLDVVRPLRGALCVLDYEDYRGTIPTADEAQAWRAIVEAVTGVVPLLYSRAGLLDAHVPDGHPLRSMPLWLSAYPLVRGAELRAWDGAHRLTLPRGWTGDRVVLWQYTSRGRVTGIDGDVDRSVGNVDDVLAMYPGARVDEGRAVA
jgi:GH25 family lysozyme M1 (1,4-beta-N-acetylmuramidase)